MKSSVGSHEAAIARRCRFRDLPEDLQVLLFEIVESADSEELLTRLENYCFVVHNLPISVFPRVPLSTDCRGQAYAAEMAGQNLPPVVVCGEKWLDGRHRVWLWRKNRMRHVPCVDLADIGFSYPFAGIAALELGNRFLRSRDTP